MNKEIIFTEKNYIPDESNTPKIQYGTVLIFEDTNLVFTFPQAFPTIPHVQVCLTGSSVEGAIAKVTGITETTCIFRVIKAHQGASISRLLNWLAISFK